MALNHLPIIYPDVGHCIYCKKKDCQLTNEHVIPYGLGGNIILPKSSCKECAKITGKVEQFVLRSMLGPSRIRLNLPTRRPKERPTSLLLDYHSGDWNMQNELVQIDEFPSSIIGFRFPEPGFLRGLSPNNNSEGEVVVKSGDELNRNSKYKQGNYIKIGSINVLLFKRFLAKVAHSYAVAEFGENAFVPCLQNFIIGNSEADAYFVGGGENPFPDTEDDSAILHHIYRQDCLNNGVKYIGIAIHLFKFAEMPRYYVVVGKTIG